MVFDKQEKNICPKCRINPNGSQTKKQQEWEFEYVKENGFCSACYNELANNKDII